MKGLKPFMRKFRVWQFIQSGVPPRGKEGMTAQWQHMQLQFHLPFLRLQQNTNPGPIPDFVP
jgi:hypothetical protein